MMAPKPMPKLPRKSLPAMPKRATLDLDQFKIDLPRPKRDPLETIIPTSPPLVNSSISRPVDQPAKRPSDQVVKANNGQKAKQLKGQMTKRPKGHRAKRVIKRHGFDVYQD